MSACSIKPTYTRSGWSADSKRFLRVVAHRFPSLNCGMETKMVVLGGSVEVKACTGCVWSGEFG